MRSGGEFWGAVHAMCVQRGVVRAGRAPRGAEKGAGVRWMLGGWGAGGSLFGERVQECVGNSHLIRDGI